MFFLTASANILLYSFISVFFIVCCYFNGELKDRTSAIYSTQTTDKEIQTSTAQGHTSNYFFYNRRKYNVKKVSASYHFPTAEILVFKQFISDYNSPLLDGYQLRGPPALL